MRMVFCKPSPARSNMPRSPKTLATKLASGPRAERTGRRCRGIELDPLYVDVIVRRWQTYTGDKARHSNRPTFEEVQTLRSAVGGAAS